MADPTFDVVSEVNLPEAQNAVAQAQKEVAQRYDVEDDQWVPVPGDPS